MSAARLWDALLAFQASPGRFSVAGREPAVLFERVLDVLILAADRPVAVPGGHPVPVEVRQAARLFVRSAMLRPGHDHYAVMGVDRSADAATIKEHYRLLMRLTHPDFRTAGDPWPEDAAARVNQAYDVLTSPVKRASLDAQLASTPSGGIRGVPSPLPHKPHPQALHRPGRRRSKRRSTWLAAGLGIGMTAAVALLWESPEDPTLTVVQRAGRPADAASPSVPDPALAQHAAGPATPAVAPAPPPAEPRETVPPATRQTLPERTASVKESSAPAVVQAPLQIRAAGPAPVPPTPDADRPVDTQAVAPAIVATGMAAPAPVPAPAPVTAPAMVVDMRPLQPLLADLLQTLGSGQTARVQRWAVAQTRQEDAAARFARAYGIALAGAEVTGLGQAQFNLQEMEGQPVVRGKVEIRVRESGATETVLKEFRLRAHVHAPSPGNPVLTRLEAD